MEFKGSKKWILDSEGYLKDEKSKVIADFFITNEKDLANAKLASKSPEILEMLKKVLDSISMQDEIEYGSEMYYKIEQLIESATKIK